MRAGDGSDVVAFKSKHHSPCNSGMPLSLVGRTKLLMYRPPISTEHVIVVIVVIVVIAINHHCRHRRLRHRRRRRRLNSAIFQWQHCTRVDLMTTRDRHRRNNNNTSNSNSTSNSNNSCLLYTSPSPRDATLSRMPSSA